MELLERDASLEALQDCLGLVRGGHGRLCLVYGEAGIGKSALVNRFCTGSQRDARILRGACDALSTPRPLGPLLDIAPQAGGRLADLVFEGAQREELFAAFLEALTGRTPTVAVIEDLHWADDATLDLIKFAGRRLAGRTAMLILTYRDDEIHNDHPLRLVLGDLASGEPLADLLDAVDLEPQRSRLHAARRGTAGVCTSAIGGRPTRSGRRLGSTRLGRRPIPGVRLDQRLAEVGLTPRPELTGLHLQSLDGASSSRAVPI
jgi:hypothetical protein